MTRQWSGTFRIGAATVGGVLAATVACVAPVTAEPLPGRPAALKQPVVTSSHSVTLLTGDVVLLERTADGRQTVTVQFPTGRPQVAYQTRELDGDAYVIPSDAAPLLDNGTLDEDLFNVTRLVEDGYDDAHVSAIPLIVQYPPGQATARAKPPALPGTTPGHTLESINATAVSGSKAETAALWSALTTSGPAARSATGTVAGAGVQRIWLDGRVKVDLAESVTQIGAPQAWAGGHDGTGVKVAVLDTGIDQTHPDLVGKVVAAENFSTDADTLDHHGHGTHVASTVAGSGAASGGARKGVAPGASLISGKVLNAAGEGADSSIIEGMEWAAAQGAKVINMSLGSGTASKGTDPMVQALDQISRSTGALFAVAAGNDGPGNSTIGSPGWADEALTVGAVDKQDRLASFSSRGPRLGDHGIKPDVMAPGVGIVAARATGTSMGTVVDDRYTQANGTSMATPHVAGAAAILAQKYPAYTNRQLKDLLISTAKTPNDTVYRQGGGRVEIPRAYRQAVYGTGTLNLGQFTPPYGTEPVSRAVTYRNGGTTDVTLALSLKMTGRTGAAAPAGLFTIGRSTVTVPAGGEASVDVTVDPGVAGVDLYGGYLVGVAGDTVVQTSLGVYFGPKLMTVTVPAIARDGRAAGLYSKVELWNPTVGLLSATYQAGKPATFQVPEGTYSLIGYIFTLDAGDKYGLDTTIVGDPELTVTGDTTVTLDARQGKKVVVDTPKPTAPAVFQLGYFRKFGDRGYHGEYIVTAPTDEAYAVPTAAVTQGEFEFVSKWTLVAPPIEMSVSKPQRQRLDPVLMLNSPRADGQHRRAVVHAGFGRPEDYTGRDVRGRIALVERGGDIGYTDKIRNAADAGATLVIVYNNAPGLLFGSAGSPGTVPIPAVGIEQATGQALIGMLAKAPVAIEYSGTAVSDYQYSLLLPNKGRIADEQTYRISDRNTTRIDAEYRGGPAAVIGADAHYALRPYTAVSFGVAFDLPRPLLRAEWLSADPETRWRHVVSASLPFAAMFEQPATSYRPGSRSHQTWFGQVVRPGIPAGLTDGADQGMPAYREGDTFTMNIFPWLDPDRHLGVGRPSDTGRTRLYRGDELLGEKKWPTGTFPAGSGSGTYRLRLEQQRAGVGWPYSTSIDTEWTFQSATPAEGRQPLPLLQVDYDLGLDSVNAAPARKNFAFTLDVGHQHDVEGPAIRTVRAWASFDDGGSWQEVDLDRIGGDKRRARLRHPQEGSATAVSLRVVATDAAGNGIDQTIVRAYGLSAKS